MDGTSLFGKVISESADNIVLMTSTLGKMTIKKSNLKSVKKVSAENIKSGKYWFENPNPNKYLLGSSAIPLEKKTGYYQNIWLFFNSGTYGFTNWFSLTGGFEIFSIMAGSDGPYFFFLNPKASFQVADNLYLGGNILYLNSLRYSSDFSGLASLNGTVTYGTSNINATASLGWGFVDGSFAKKPIISFSGMARFSKRLAFISENWILPVEVNNKNIYGIYSYGLRFLGEKTSFDLAFINNKDIADQIVIGIPFVDFVFNF